MVRARRTRIVPAALLVLLLAAHAPAQSLLCRLVRCDDGNPCTVDSCRGPGICVFAPVRCDDGDPCTTDACDAVGACRVTPRRCDDGNPCTGDACAAGACRHTPLDGVACPDDGFACTDDACAGGTCLHVPIDSRCLAGSECASAACAPLAAGADAAGCVGGVPLAEGAECAEDGLPCTDDVCRGAACGHLATPDAATCEPVTKAFRLALALAAQARGLVPAVRDLGAGDAAAARALARLAAAEVALHDAARTLAGKVPLPAAAGAGGLARTPAQRRAAAAAVRLAGLRGALRELLGDLRGAGGRDRAAFVDVRGRGRALRRGVRRLGAELRRLQRVQQTFAPHTPVSGY
jgi:hypothetical protein